MMWDESLHVYPHQRSSSDPEIHEAKDENHAISDYEAEYSLNHIWLYFLSAAAVHKLCRALCYMHTAGDTHPLIMLRFVQVSPGDVCLMCLHHQHTSTP